MQYIIPTLLDGFGNTYAITYDQEPFWMRVLDSNFIIHRMDRKYGVIGVLRNDNIILLSDSQKDIIEKLGWVVDEETYYDYAYGTKPALD